MHEKRVPKGCYVIREGQVHIFMIIVIVAKKKVNFPSRIKDLVRIFQIVKNVVKNSPELKEETHFSKSMRFV